MISILRKQSNLDVRFFVFQIKDKYPSFLSLIDHKKGTIIEINKKAYPLKKLTTTMSDENEDCFDKSTKAYPLEKLTTKMSDESEDFDKSTNFSNENRERSL
jgi:hypothetical protein